MRRIVALVAVCLSWSCSAAGFKGYGPKGDKFIGSAAGYSDSRISERTFFVSYTDGSLDKAVPKFHRRAAELCAALGFGSYDVTASAPGKETVARFTSTVFGIPVQSPDGLPMYQGYVTCKASGAPNVAMSAESSPAPEAPNTRPALVQLAEILSKSADESPPSDRPTPPDEPRGASRGRTSSAGAARGAPPTGSTAQAVNSRTQPQPSAPQPLERRSGGAAASPGSARIMFYMSSAEIGAVNVFVDDLVQGGLISSFGHEPSCGAPGAITIRVKPGPHKLYAEAAGGKATWGPVTRSIADGECVGWNIGRSSASSGNGNRGGINRPELATFGVWTHLDAKDIYLALNGLIGPTARTYFGAGEPTECSDIGVASRQYKRGERVVLEVRRSMDHTSPVVLRREFVLDKTCTIFELR
jgi:hypothetical protein